ncbi:mitochondrial carrier domain-containing protein [Calycina marina]|uniref:Mitochondrial carrier domain-containing protein n=1 Tax=Calycina marina TaxID=1763456 RepID=A0A9P7ZAW2_9HELO|nr:mitochondrial carrier domain-containing protein [Calycina marina]
MASTQPGQQDGIQPEQLNDPYSRKPSNQKIWPKRYRTELAASASSLLSTFAAFPLDSVKTRMQTYRYDSIMDCVRHTYRTEGYQGFFRGVMAPLASVTVVRTISFSVYQKSKYTYSEWMHRNFGIDPLVHVNTLGTIPNFASMACFAAAGATAGSFITVVACPFELTKVSAQVAVLMTDSKAKVNASSMSEPITINREVAASYQNKGTFKTAKNIIKHRGAMGLYSGFHLHLARDTLGTATYFMTYESAKQLLTTYRGDRSPTNPLAVVFAGGLCGAASWMLIYPIDTAKSKYQRSCLAACKGEEVQSESVKLWKKDMYSGLGVSILRSAVVNAIFFSAFELIKKEINNMDG